MSAPRRWLEDGEVDDLDRALLSAGLDADPPSGRKNAVWASLLAQLPPGGSGGDLGGPGDAGPHGGPGEAPGLGGLGDAASSVGSAGGATGAAAGAANVGVKAAIFKAMALGVATVAVVRGGAHLVERSAPEAPAGIETRAPAPPRASPAPSAEHVEARAPDLEEEEEVPPVEAPVAPVAPVSPMPAPRAQAPRGRPEGPAARASLLREESLLVAEARKALRSGRPAEALRLLEGARAKFEGGALAQEREVLAIEALAESGRRAEAASRAEAFLRLFPHSPHADRVRALAP